MVVETYRHPILTVKPPRPLFVTKIECSTDGSGNCDIDSKFINGQILKIYYDKGTVSASTTAVITFDGEAIDSYNVNSGSAHRYPRVETISEPFVVSGYLNIAVTGGQANKTFDVYIFAW